MRRSIAGMALAAAAATIAPFAGGLAVAEGEAAGPGTANIAVTITIVDSETPSGPMRRAYRLVARDGGGAASLLMGWRMPVPTSRGAEHGGEAGGMSFVYQNIGVSAQVEVATQPDGRIRVHGEIEASGLRDPSKMPGAPAGLPIIGTFQQQVDIDLTPGKTVPVAEVPDPEGGQIRMELQAEPLR